MQSTRLGSSEGALDASGALQARTDWAYTARSQQASATYTVAETTGIRTFSWGYDSGGRMTSITYPGEETVSYTYDEAWRQTSACSSLIGVPCYAQNATYTALDQPTQFSLGSGALQAYQYNGVMARLSNIQVQAGGTALLSKSYTYDNVGNVWTILNSALSSSPGTVHRSFTAGSTSAVTPAETGTQQIAVSMSRKLLPDATARL